MFWKKKTREMDAESYDYSAYEEAEEAVRVIERARRTVEKATLEEIQNYAKFIGDNPANSVKEYAERARLLAYYTSVLRQEARIPEFSYIPDDTPDSP